MKLIVCCATPWELKTVKWEIKKLNLKKSLDINYLCTGIGNYETIATLTNYLSTNSSDDSFLLNIWICWYKSKGNKTPPKVIQIWRIKNIHTNKEQLPPIPFILWEINSCYSSEIAILEAPQEEIDFQFFEMEARGIELCCNKFNIPHIFLKVPYDRIGEETKNFNKEDACNKLSSAIDFEKVITNILEYTTN